jgi:hypothetical protein
MIYLRVLPAAASDAWRGQRGLHHQIRNSLTAERVGKFNSEQRGYGRTALAGLNS